MSADKDVIYVDIDDEITTIIDKVRGSTGKVIALVLPKRATVFQSIVNMKLLKRAADSAKKHLVLVTTEANLMPLAGAVGLHVASTPQSKPEIPVSIQANAPDDSLDEPIDESAFTADNAGDQAVGDLAWRSGHVAAGGAAEEMAELDDEDDEDGEETPAKVKKNRHLKVPNFNKFRLRLILVILLIIVLVGGFVVANMYLPKATIAITTNSSTVNVNISPTLDTKAKALDTTKLIVPATSASQQNTVTQQVATTGQKNTGDTATGSVTMTAQSCNLFNPPQSIPAGTGVSTNGLTFITQSNVSFSPVPPYSNCEWQGSGSVAITAQSPGAKYNVSSASFTVAGRSDVTATGSASGGTDNIIDVVAQADIDSAKKKLGSQNTSSIQTALADTLSNEGLYPISATFNAGTPKVTTDKNVGDQADNVTVTEVITYTMLGVKQSDLDALIKSNIGSQIDTKTQVIVNDGMSQATVTVGGTSGSQTQIAVQTSATIGPDLNAATIKQEAAGKQVGDVKSMINQVPGVVSVDVQLSPFWVNTVPTNPHQVVVTIDKGK